MDIICENKLGVYLYLYREIEVMMLFEIDVLIIYYSFNGFIINIK